MRPTVDLVLAVTCLALAGCGSQSEKSAAAAYPTYSSPPIEAAPVSITTTPTAYSPPEPTHNYVEVRDGTYFYVASVSEEERKLGKAAGRVSGYRYFGRNADGEHELAYVYQSGALGFRARCPDNCRIIRFSSGEPLAYNPASIIGGAFEDAINGFLRRSPERKPVLPVTEALPLESMPAVPRPTSSPPGAEPTSEVPAPVQSSASTVDEG